LEFNHRQELDNNRIKYEQELEREKELWRLAEIEKVQLSQALETVHMQRVSAEMERMRCEEGKKISSRSPQCNPPNSRPNRIASPPRRRNRTS
jgi:hypothetical protein